MGNTNITFVVVATHNNYLNNFLDDVEDRLFIRCKGENLSTSMKHNYHFLKGPLDFTSDLLINFFNF